MFDHRQCKLKLPSCLHQRLLVGGCTSDVKLNQQKYVSDFSCCNQFCSFENVCNLKVNDHSKVTSLQKEGQSGIKKFSLISLGQSLPSRTFETNGTCFPNNRNTDSSITSFFAHSLTDFSALCGILNALSQSRPNDLNFFKKLLKKNNSYLFHFGKWN